MPPTPLGVAQRFFSTSLPSAVRRTRYNGGTPQSVERVPFASDLDTAARAPATLPNRAGWGHEGQAAGRLARPGRSPSDRHSLLRPETGVPLRPCSRHLSQNRLPVCVNLTNSASRKPDRIPSPCLLICGLHYKRQQCPALTVHDLKTVIAFFALQVRRSLAGRCAAADYIHSDEAVDDLTNDFIRHTRKKYIGYNNIILPNTYDNVRSSIALGLKRVDVKEMSVKAILAQEDRTHPNSLIHELCRRGLTIGVIKKPTHLNSFVLGNNPIIEAGSGGSSNLRTNPEAERVLPIAPDVGISLVGPTGSVSLISLDDISHIEELNFAVTKQSTEIVANNRELLENLGRSIWWERVAK